MQRPIVIMSNRCLAEEKKSNSFRLIGAMEMDLFLMVYKIYISREGHSNTVKIFKAKEVENQTFKHFYPGCRLIRQKRKHFGE